MSDLIHINSVSDAHRLMGFGKPEHPLISIFQHKPDFENPIKDARITSTLYFLALKEGFKGSFAYGRDVYKRQDKDYFILSYTFADYNMPAATFLVGSEAEYPLTGPCSFFMYPEIFLIGEKLYLQGGSSCCDCGINVQQLFEFNGKELKAVLEDGSWST